jgi:hypothetical protein
MSTTVLHPARLAPAAKASAASTGFWRRLWASLEAHGQRRAEAELRRLAATHVSTDPELSRHLRALIGRPSV